jgi:hypothetical protein
MKTQIESDLRRVRQLQDDRLVEQSIVAPVEFVAPKDPTRSIYYDPVFNPYGAPPPGMPYREIAVQPSSSVEHFPNKQFVETKSSVVGKKSVVQTKHQEPVIVEDVISEEEGEEDDDFDSLSNLGILHNSNSRRSRRKRSLIHLNTATSFKLSIP